MIDLDNDRGYMIKDNLLYWYFLPKRVINDRPFGVRIDNVLYVEAYFIISLKMIRDGLAIEIPEHLKFLLDGANYAPAEDYF